MRAGFVKLRRGIMEHVKMGRMTVDEYAAYTFIIQLANHKSGFWRGCAEALGTEMGKSKRWAQRILSGLRTKGYISGQPSTGRGRYPIRVTKYFEKGTVVSPSTQEGDCGVTQTRQKGTILSPYKEEVLIQEVRHKNPPLASLAAPVMEKSGFDAFWEIYPRKVGKFMARKAWDKISGIEEHVLEIIQSIEGWKRSEQWQDAQFIPYPATFLNQRRWQDEIPSRGVTKNERRILNTLDAIARVTERDEEMARANRGALSSGVERAGSANLLRLARPRGPGAA